MTGIDTVIYSPESQLRSPVQLARSMWRDLLACRELAWRLTVRDVSAKYRQSLLGVLWAFLPPIATALLFVILNREGAISVSVPEIPYAAFVLVGTVLWQLFVDSLNAPLQIVCKNKSMLSRINFPREALILSAIMQVLFDFAIRVTILVAVFLFYGVDFHAGLLLSPIAIVFLMLLGLGIGLLLTPIGVLYSDVSSGLSTFVSLWFFATPVIYPPPTKWPYSLLVDLNPVAPMIVGTRDLITLGTISNVFSFVIVSGATCIGLIAMWIVYRVSLPILIERMSA